ncbi:acyl-CoA carboxylase epsilon subunit [Streptomyces sp. MZ04]|uniref:acyl-CoA carboxylase epsilon subunit n=1 Tax=Streptomyces sp. MZ04 TaxID=2559236 RepID=UPI0014329D5A|nr:acyl-CoA carboxylase epsilon subunit [Streptomyces sp. MZ04]
MERGQAGEDELTAIAVVLLALHRRGQEESESEAEQPSSPALNWWKRPNGYASPDSWR